MATFFKCQQIATDDHAGDNERILKQAQNAGFSGRLKIYNLGFDTEDSISLVIEGTYEGERCCVAVGYGMNRQKLAIRKKWHRHAPTDQ